MAEAAAPAPAKKATKVKKPAKPATHPKFSEMIAAAITALKDRKGSSCIAIKKYILANYKVDEKAVNTFVKANLNRGVKSGALKQVKGTGASGSFKLAEKAAPKKKAAAKKTKKPAAKKAPAKPKKAAKSPKKTATKKAADKPKKAAKSPKKPVAKKAKKPAAKKAAKK